MSSGCALGTSRRSPRQSTRFDANAERSDPPEPWADQVDDQLVAARLANRVHQLLPGLPEHQRQVVMLRDVEGLGMAAVSALLGITDGNQRVLLHRGRARLRECLTGTVQTHDRRA